MVEIFHTEAWAQERGITVNGEKAQNLVQIFFLLFPLKKQKTWASGKYGKSCHIWSIGEDPLQQGEANRKKILRKEVDSMT